MTVIHSPNLANTPSLARLAAAAPAAPLDPVWQGAISRQPPPGRDRVAEAPAEPAPPFAYRTDPRVMDMLPIEGRAVLRRLDDAATEARDRSVALARHLDAARDRVGIASIDVTAAIRAAGLAEVATLGAAREIVASGRWPAAFTEPMRELVRRIVREGERLAEAEAEVDRLAERRREHAAATAPIVALRERVARALGRARPPFKVAPLPEVETKRAAALLATARETIAEAAAEIARLEGDAVHPADVQTIAAEAVARHAAAPHAFVSRSNGTVLIDEPAPGAEAGDRAPVRPLAVLCGVMPDAVAAWIAAAIPTAPDAPRLAARPAMLAEARRRLREAELAERAAIAAMGDPLDRLAERAEADPLLVVLVEAGR